VGGGQGGQGGKGCLRAAGLLIVRSPATAAKFACASCPTVQLTSCHSHHLTRPPRCPLAPAPRQPPGKRRRAPAAQPARPLACARRGGYDSSRTAASIPSIDIRHALLLRLPGASQAQRQQTHCKSQPTAALAHSPGCILCLPLLALLGFSYLQGRWHAVHLSESAKGPGS
jgi:hypothetical protein